MRPAEQTLTRPPGGTGEGSQRSRLAGAVAARKVTDVTHRPPDPAGRRRLVGIILAAIGVFAAAVVVALTLLMGP